MARRLLVPLAAAALVLGAAGCSDGDPEPRETDLIDLSGDDPSDGGGEQPSDGGGGEPSDGGEEEPVSAAPDIPAPNPADYPGMDENTHKGAIEYSEYFVAAMYWGFATGDSSLVGENSTDECRSCVEVVDTISEAAKSGDLSAPVEILSAESQSFPSEAYDIEVAYFYNIGALGVGGVDSSGEYVPYRALVGVVWVDESWKVAGLVIEQEGEGDGSEG